MAAETSSEAAAPPPPGGWHVTTTGLTKAAEAKTPDSSGKWLLDVDLREDGEASLPRQFDGLKAPGIFQPSLDCICPKPDQDDGLVLQVKSVRNVAAPKANEESGAAPRMLKMSLTDGHTTIHGLETSKLDGVSINSAPPGSKVRIQGKIPISSTGFLLLETGTVKCLGGKVAGLTDKWEQNRKLAHFTRAKSHGSGGTAVSGTEGPPPWVPFGKKIKSNIDHSDQQQQASNAKKSEQPKQQQQQIGAGDDETNGDDEGECEFDSQRQDAIKELSTTTKKVFGGGTKEIKDGGRKGRSNTAQAVSLSSPPNDDSSVKGKDNSETSAKGRRGGGGSDPIEASLSDTLRGERRGKKGRKGARGEADGAADGSKPADKVHLFDFLGEKFPDAEEPTKESIASAAANSSSLQNNGRKFGDNSNTSLRNKGNSTNEGGKGRDTNRRGENRNSDSRRGGGDRQQQQQQPQQQRRDGEREKPPRHQQQQDRSDKRQNGSSIKKWDLSERPPRSDRPERSDNRNDRDHQTSSRGRGYRDHHLEGSNHNGGRQDRRNGGGDRGGSSASAGAGGRGGRRGGGQQHGGSGGGQAQGGRDFGEWCNSTYHNATAQQQQRNSGGQRPNHYSQQSTASAISQQRQQHRQELLASMKNMNLADMGKQQQHHHHENTNGHQQHSNSSGGYGTNYPANNQPGRGKSRQQQQWKVGDECLAKYWEDEKYYPVRVTAISKNNTAVVYFLEYGNHEEVFLNDIRPSKSGGGGGGAGSKSTSSGGGFIPTTPGLPPAFPQTY